MPSPPKNAASLKPNPSLPRQIPPLRILNPPTNLGLNPRATPLPIIPSISTSTSSSFRNNILLIIPTANASKTRLLTAHLNHNLPPSSTLHTLTLPATSNAGEQPYDSLGPIGARNRIANALTLFTSSPDHLSLLTKHQIGTVIIGAVENFIIRNYSSNSNGEEKKAVPAPVDFGYVALYNATSGKLETGISRGVRVPVEYLKEAESYGFEDEEDEDEDGDGDGERKKGKVTVGEALAANIEGLDKADWHKVLSVGKVSRYDLLKEALDGLEVPWSGTD
ncbi:hypothetical protein QBC44DRAFT_294548 [Cladorrhinum sp. PSN332]|nr:hypothetical protein QBC44DRAFT_294548 [Cladorrhinum sp. PSN332]